MHNLSVRGIKRCRVLFPKLSWHLEFFFFAVPGMANVSPLDIVCFEERVYFYELLNIQVQCSQFMIALFLRSVELTVYKPVVGTFSGLTLQSSPWDLVTCLALFAFFFCFLRVYLQYKCTRGDWRRQKIPQVFIETRNPPDTTQCETLLLLKTAHRLLVVI